MSKMSMIRQILIGCGSRKAMRVTPAGEIYIGGLFAARRQYAEASGLPWFIVSAKYGILDPSTLVKPYDLKISDLSQVDRAAWKLGTVMQLLDRVGDAAELRRISFELHLGADYAEPLSETLLNAGFSYSWPVKGLGIGEQLKWYAERRQGARGAA